MQWDAFCRLASRRILRSVASLSNHSFCRRSSPSYAIDQCAIGNANITGRAARFGDDYRAVGVREREKAGANFVAGFSHSKRRRHLKTVRSWTPRTMATSDAGTPSAMITLLTGSAVLSITSLVLAWRAVGKNLGATGAQEEDRPTG
jgi:hypothetical protein